MSDIAKLEIDGKTYEFPIFRGTENEVAIDIKTLRTATGGVITIDPGFENGELNKRPNTLIRTTYFT